MRSKLGGVIVLFNLNSIILGKKKFVNPKIRICIGCGSTTVFQNKKSIMCKDCGNVGYFSNEHLTVLKLHEKEVIV